MFKSILLFSLLFSYASCGSGVHDVISLPSATPENSMGWSLVSEYQMTPSEGKFTQRFDFTRNFRIWSRGSSDSKANQIMFTDDFGKSWKFIDLPDSGIGSDGMIRFVDPQNGWAIDTSALFSTIDGGLTWKNIRLPNKSKMNTINSLEFKDANHGFVAGSTTLMDRGIGTINFGIEIICTDDGGENWSICYKNNRNNTPSKIIEFGSFVIVLVDQKTLLVSDNNGVSWKEKHLEFAATDIDVSPDSVLWTSGEDGLIRSSDDLGDNWKTVSVDLKIHNPRLNSISFDTTGFGVAVGSGGVVVSTVDSGASWKRQEYLNLHSDLWTVRVQRPYVAILDEAKLSVFDSREQ